MDFTMNYKAKISFILTAGLFIVSIITAISMYSVYQYKYVQLLTSSTKVVTLFEDTFKDILQDFQYFKSIDFSDNSKKTLADFKKVALITYNHNKNVNAISLIKQFNTVDYKEIRENLPFMSNKKDFNIRAVTNIIENSKKSGSTFSSIIIHSEPMLKVRRSIGIDVASEENRYNTISQMNNTNTYAISEPVKLVHKYKGNIVNSILFYPLYKDKNTNFYKWYVAAPFTYKKILDNIIGNNSSFTNLHVEIIDNDKNSIVCTCDDHSFVDEIHDYMTLILEKKVNIGDKQYLIKISTDSIWTFNTFWLNILGFFSGILFLFFIGFYLFYKEQKNIEISLLKFRLAEAQKISSSGHGIWKKEKDDFLCSEGLANILKLEDLTIKSKKIFNMIYEKDKLNIYNLISNLKTKSILENGNIIFRMNVENTVIWLKIEYRGFYDSNDTLKEVFIVAQDITSFKTLEVSLKRNNEEFKRISITDHLTGAYNRAYFDKEIENALSRHNQNGQLFSILLLDIDHFKKINDNYGHNEGDNVLVAFSKLIKQHLRETDLFARWGGEEFSILIPHLDKDKALNVADKLRVIIQNYNFSNQYNITCSIGVTQPEKNEDSISLFKRVDKALYAAKEDGRNKVKLV